MRSPVLFLVFNRPDVTRRVFETIRAARPPRLYVAADGARPSRDGEAERCAEVRAIATGVDWPCEVKTLLRTENLGCKRAVSSGIGWFFENEPEGVILEDDCEATPAFFAYCDELLERYRDDERVACVSGSSFTPEALAAESSYVFTRYADIWGWATWRRSWKHYDVAMQAWPAWRDAGGLKAISRGDRIFERYWSAIFDLTHAGGVDTWDYQWQFACWLRGAFGAMSTQPQINNLGFGADATHTAHTVPDYVKPVRPLSFPLRHPRRDAPDPRIDRAIGVRRYYLGWLQELRRRILAVPRVRSAALRLRAALRPARA